MLKLTVVVPIYNVEPYLVKCLDSLRAQTLQDVEFLCIDDGSTDASGKIADEYVKKDQRFRVIHKGNEGYGKTMNLGLQEAHGEYVGIVESDDFVDAQMFEKLYETAVSTGADIVKSNFYTYDADNGIALFELLKGCRYRQMCSAAQEPNLLMTCMYIWTAIYRRSFLERNQIRFRETPSAAHQDIGFYLKTMAVCKKIYLVPESYLYYRVNRKDSSVQHLERRTQFYEEFMDYWSFLRQRCPEEQASGAAAAPNMLLRYQNDVWPILPVGTQYHHLKRAWNDFQQLKQEGFLIEKYWTSKDWEMLQYVLNHPKAWLVEQGVDQQQKILLKRGLIASCRGLVGGLYLYGAGQVAKWLIQQLRKENIEVQGLLVERPESNPEQVDGVSVRAFGDDSINRESSFVLMALSPRKDVIQQQVYCMLKDSGFRHVVILTKILQESIALDDDA